MSGRERDMATPRGEYPGDGGRSSRDRRRRAVIGAAVVLIVLVGIRLLGRTADDPAEATGTGVAVAAAQTPDAGNPMRVVSHTTRTMGTYANVTFVTPDSAKSHRDAMAADRAFHRVDSLMSNWTDISEVARINREAAGQAVTVEPEVASVIGAALAVTEVSDGAFDITVEPLVRLWGFLGGTPDVPTDEEIRAVFDRVGTRHVAFDPETRVIRFDAEGVKVDLGGIAKGYGVDAAVAALRANEVDHALVDISGNMYALGHPLERDAWAIGIRDPLDRMMYFAALHIVDAAVATSGVYEQFVVRDGKTYGHILDPRTGYPADGLISVTVVADEAMTADAWGTALFVLGPDQARQISKAREDIAAVLVEPVTDENSIVWVEESLRERFVIQDQVLELFDVRYY